MTEQTGLLTTLSRYARSNLANKAAGLLYAYLKPRLLNPEIIGIWSVLTVFLTYASYSHLGARSSLRYLIPKLLANGESDELALAKGTVYIGTFVTSLLFAIVIAAASFWGDYQPVTRIGLFCIALLILLYWNYEYYLTVLKGAQKFSIINGGNYLRIIFQIFVGVGLIGLFGVYGLYAATGVTILSAIVWFHIKYKDRRTFRFDRSLYLRLVGDGWSILLYNAILALLATVDRLVIGSQLDVTRLGYYTIGITVSGIVINVSASVRDVTEPKLAQDIARGRERRGLYRYFLRPLYNTAYYYPLLLVGVWFILPPLIRFALPRYTAGTMATQLLVCGAGFLALLYCLRGVIVVRQWQLGAVGVLLLSVGLNLGLNITFIHLGYGIAGVAAGTGIAYLFLFVAMYSYVVRRLGAVGFQFRAHFVQILAPFFFSFGLVAAADSFLSPLTGSAVVDALIKTILVGSILLGAIYLAEKRNRLIHCFITTRLKKRREGKRG